MRIFLSILFVLFAKLLPAQKTDTIKKYLDKNFVFTSKSGMAYTATVFPEDTHWVLRAVYSDRSLLIEANFLDKKLAIKDGAFRAYYPGGIPAIFGNYQDGQRTGVWKSWYKNGQLKDSGFIKNDNLTGTWTTWFDNGSVMTRAHFDDKPVSTGSEQIETNEKISILTFPPTTTVKNGVWESWSVNGLQKDSGNYKNDVKVGFWRSWYENGKPESEGTYSDNENLDGDWIFYREDGTISTKEKYAAHKLTDLKCFDEKGNYSGVFCNIAKLPVLLGTPYDWKLFFDTHLEWSTASLKKSREATITIRFHVGKDGKLVNHTLLNSPSTQVSEDIEKVIRLMTDWSPAVLHNRPFEYSFDYSIPFYPG